MGSWICCLGPVSAGASDRARAVIGMGEGGWEGFNCEYCPLFQHDVSIVKTKSLCKVIPGLITLCVGRWCYANPLPPSARD